jgi:hypothetical protein
MGDEKQTPKAIKITQLTGGILLLLAGIFFIILTLLINLVPSSFKNTSLVVWIIIPFFLILFTEGALYWISASSKINEENLKETGRKDFISQTTSAIALIFKYGSLIKNIIGILVILAIIGLTISYFVPLMNQISFSTPFYVDLGIYFVWFVIIRRFVIKAIYKGSPNLRKQLPSYSLEKGGIIFNLKFKEGQAGIFILLSFILGIASVILVKVGMNQYALITAGLTVLFFILAVSKFGGKTTFYPIQINFKEIDEIRELTFVESQSLMKYQVGPNVSLEVQGAKDMYEFLKKKIERPSVYVMTPSSSVAKTLFIKGKNLFYLSAMENENFNDLISAFKKYKKK